MSDRVIDAAASFARCEAAFPTSPLFRELEESAKDTDFKRFENAAKRHHFVPQFFLRGFALPGDKRRMFQLDVKSGKPSRVNIDEAASRRKLYSFTRDDGSENNLVEGFHALIERHAARALTRLVAEPHAIDDATRATLAYFFAVLSNRTPAALKSSERFGDNAFRMLSASRLQDLNAFPQEYRDLFGESASDAEIEAFRLDMLDKLASDDIQIDARGQTLGLIFSAAAEISQYVFCMDWEIKRREAAFITSDRGIAMFDPTPDFPWTGNAWMASDNAVNYVPLTRDICLVLVPGTGKLEVEDISASEANRINLRIYGWADRHVFGHSQTIVSNTRRLAKQHPTLAPRAIPARQVILLEARPDDTELARANVARGWPPYLRHEGVRHDYIVLNDGENAVEAFRRTSELVMNRVRSDQGLDEDEQPGGNPAFQFINPGEIS